jgi:hypothetical protein
MTTTLKLWFQTLKALLTNTRALLIFIALYSLLLVSFYFFISTREATAWQVLVTYVLLLLVPLEFFMLQAAILNHAREYKFRWSQIGRDALKLIAITIPIILIGWGLWWLLNKWQGRYPTPLPAITFATGPSKPQPMHWPTTVFATLRFLLFAVALPLATIHLWIEVTARDVRSSFAGGLKGFLKRLGSSLARASSSDSVFTYILGLIFFVFVPYAIFFVPVTIKGTKTDFAVFVLRLLLAFAFMLIGWVVTIATLTRSANGAPEARQNVAPGLSPGDKLSQEILSPL